MKKIKISYLDFDLSMTLNDTNYKIFSLIYKNEDLIILKKKNSKLSCNCRGCNIL